MSRKKYLAVDFGNKKIKMVYGRFKNKVFEVYKYAIIDTPENSIRDGKLLNPDIIAAQIQSAKRKYGMRTKKLVMTITGTTVITRDIKIPKSNDKEIAKILEFEAPQYFPVSLENYVLDYKVLEDLPGEDGNFLRILLVAVPNAQVEDYMKIPLLLKMNAISIDIPANCVNKYLFLNIDPKEYSQTGEFAVVNFGAETTEVCIFSNSALMFSRIVLTGSVEVDKLISNMLDIDYADAEKIKLEKGKVILVEDERNESEEVIRFSNAIRSAIDSIAGDVARFLEFYNSRVFGNKIKQVYICGGGSKLIGLEQYLARFLNMPVECFSYEKRVVYKVKAKREKFKEDFVQLINPIGALARDK